MGRARRLRKRTLFDRDRRREPVDAFDVRLRQLLEELPRVGRERLDVTTLALRVNRIERERRFPRPARPRQNDELAARQRDRDILKVVLPRADYRDPIDVGSRDPRYRLGGGRVDLAKRAPWQDDHIKSDLKARPLDHARDRPRISRPTLRRRSKPSEMFARSSVGGAAWSNAWSLRAA